jgi:hypothetical protein
MAEQQAGQAGQGVQVEPGNVEHSDGQSVAAWTSVAILLLAAFLVSLAVVVTSWPLAIVGMVLVVVGVVAGKVLAMAGFGQSRPAPSSQATAAR